MPHTDMESLLQMLDASLKVCKGLVYLPLALLLVKCAVATDFNRYRDLVSQQLARCLPPLCGPSEVAEDPAWDEDAISTCIRALLDDKEVLHLLPTEVVQALAVVHWKSQHNGQALARASTILNMVDQRQGKESDKVAIMLPALWQDTSGKPIDYISGCFPEGALPLDRSSFCSYQQQKKWGD